MPFVEPARQKMGVVNGAGRGRQPTQARVPQHERKGCVDVATGEGTEEEMDGSPLLHRLLKQVQELEKENVQVRRLMIGAV